MYRSPVKRRFGVRSSPFRENPKTLLSEYLLTSDTVRAKNLILKHPGILHEIFHSEDPVFFIARNDPEIIPFLIEEKVDWNLKNSKGETFIFHCNYEIMKMLDDAKVGVDWNVINNEGENALFKYKYSCYLREVEFLLKKGVSPNKQNVYGVTPLMKSEDFKVLKLLLEYGADPNIEDDNRRNAMFFARSEKMVKILEKYGCVVKRDIYGEFPFERDFHHLNDEIRQVYTRQVNDALMAGLIQPASILSKFHYKNSNLGDPHIMRTVLKYSSIN